MIGWSLTLGDIRPILGHTYDVCIFKFWTDDMHGICQTAESGTFYYCLKGRFIVMTSYYKFICKLSIRCTDLKGLFIVFLVFMSVRHRLESQVYSFQNHLCDTSSPFEGLLLTLSCVSGLLGKLTLYHVFSVQSPD